MVFVNVLLFLGVPLQNNFLSSCTIIWWRRGNTSVFQSFSSFCLILQFLLFPDIMWHYILYIWDIIDAALFCFWAFETIDAMKSGTFLYGIIFYTITGVGFLIPLYQWFKPWDIKTNAHIEMMYDLIQLVLISLFEGLYVQCHSYWHYCQGPHSLW